MLVFRGVTNKNQVEEFLKEVGPRSFVFENPIVDLAKFLLGMPTLFLSYGEREREREGGRDAVVDCLTTGA